MIGKVLIIKSLKRAEVVGSSVGHYIGKRDLEMLLEIK